MITCSLLTHASGFLLGKRHFGSRLPYSLPLQDRLRQEPDINLNEIGIEGQGGIPDSEAIGTGSHTGMYRVGLFISVR